MRAKRRTAQLRHITPIYVWRTGDVDGENKVVRAVEGESSAVEFASNGVEDIRTAAKHTNFQYL